MSERESWMPSFNEMDEHLFRYLCGSCALTADREHVRALIRAAVEKAVAEQRETWIAALKTAYGEYTCHPDFAEMWAKAEVDPTYWAELLSSSRDAYHKQDARHAREVERAKLEGKIETMTQVGGYADRITELRAAIAALDKEEKL